MKSMWRLAVRSSGFELAAFGLITVAIVAAMAVFAFLLEASSPSAECVTAGPVGACTAARSFFDMSARANQLIVFSGLIPLALGAVLGSQLFSRDIERGSMQLPWSMSPSRARWYAERLLITGGFVFLLLALLAVATMALEAAIHPDVSPMATFLDFGFRGPSVVARGLAAFVVSAVIGLTLGRPFPALLSGIVVAAAVAFASQPIAIATQSSTVVSPLGRPQVAYAIVRDDLFQATDGRLLTMNEVTALVPPAVDDPYGWIADHFTEVAVGVGGDRYPAVEVVACGFLLAVGALTLAGGLVIARRRRPY